MTPVLRVPIEGDEKMPTDLSADVSNHLMTARIASNQQVTQSMADGANFVMEQSRLGYLDRQREVGLLEGRTASGVLATPIASPTAQG